MSEKIRSHAAGSQEKGQSKLRQKQQNRECANPFAVSAEARHAVEVSQKQRGKNRGSENR